ncbi:hypothetical protein J4558_19260 [Leptolyngbya sp. 15MV]|nr:hypothetical protein J4558_19260 [Leptolyngbya sp. 15MV]
MGQLSGATQDADDRWPPRRVQLLPRGQQAQHLVRRGAGQHAFRGRVRRFGPGFGQRAIEGVGRGLVADGAPHQQDLVGPFLHLAEPFLEGDGTREILDTDAEQRQRRDLKQLGQPPDGVQLDDLALFVAVERGAGHAEPGGDLLRPQPAFEPVGPQLLPDIGEAHAIPRGSPEWATTMVRETESHLLEVLANLRDERPQCNTKSSQEPRLLRRFHAQVVIMPSTPPSDL